jgi:hypothetical protein
MLKSARPSAPQARSRYRAMVEAKVGSRVSKTTPEAIDDRGGVLFALVHEFVDKASPPLSLALPSAD